VTSPKVGTVGLSEMLTVANIITLPKLSTDPHQYRVIMSVHSGLESTCMPNTGTAAEPLMPAHELVSE